MTLYKATCQVFAPEMADTITATLSIGNEAVETDTYSVKTYGDTFLTPEFKAAFLSDNKHTEEEYNKLAALVQTMLNYGAATQIQFAPENTENNPNNDTTHSMEDLANANIDYKLVGLSDDEINSIDADIPNKEAINSQLAQSGATSGYTYYGYTMLRHSNTKLRFYFKKDSPDSHTYSIQLVKKLEGIDSSINYTVKDDENNSLFAYVEVPGIPAYELYYKFELRAGGKLGSFSALSYIKDVLTDDSSDPVLVNTVTAMYRYHEAAVDWFNWVKTNNQGGQ